MAKFVVLKPDVKADHIEIRWTVMEDDGSNPRNFFGEFQDQSSIDAALKRSLANTTFAEQLVQKYAGKEFILDEKGDIVEVAKQ